MRRRTPPRLNPAASRPGRCHRHPGRRAAGVRRHRRSWSCRPRPSGRWCARRRPSAVDLGPPPSGAVGLQVPLPRHEDVLVTDGDVGRVVVALVGDVHVGDRGVDGHVLELQPDVAEAAGVDLLLVPDVACSLATGAPRARRLDGDGAGGGGRIAATARLRRGRGLALHAGGGQLDGPVLGGRVHGRRRTRRLRDPLPEQQHRHGDQRAEEQEGQNPGHEPALLDVHVHLRMRDGACSLAPRTPARNRNRQPARSIAAWMSETSGPMTVRVPCPGSGPRKRSWSASASAARDAAGRGTEAPSSSACESRKAAAAAALPPAGSRRRGRSRRSASAGPAG